MYLVVYTVAAYNINNFIYTLKSKVDLRSEVLTIKYKTSL